MSPTRIWVPQFYAVIVYAMFTFFPTRIESILIRPTAISGVSTLTSSSSRTVTSGNMTIKNALTVKCDGAQYGLNLDAADCRDARGYINVGSEENPWVDRDFPFADYHFAVPYRWMSGQGRCYIQVDLAAGYSVGYASPNQVRKAAIAIITKCGVGDTLQGGSANMIGADGGVTMFISAYQADVNCRGVFTPRGTCASILDDMEATQVSQTFGPGSDSTAQVKLPAVIEARDHKSSVRVFGTTDTTSWYQIWEAAMLIYSQCVRKGAGGSVRGLGDHGKLFVTMTAQTGFLSNDSQTELDSFD